MSFESALPVVVFALFVGVTLGLSFYLGRSARSSQGYFAAHGQIHWFVNGIAFAGDYLSAASFLGICGMIAFSGYDGFLYSIGYLAGWVVALFVIAEPMKRLGTYTFADALNSRFQSSSLKFVVGISTLVISLFYLIPQMVGAGALIQPLLGLPHHVGVILVGATVIAIVVTAGMISTTYVQFLKGGLLIAFSGVLVAMVLARGLRVADGGVDGYAFATLGPVPVNRLEEAFHSPGAIAWAGAKVMEPTGPWKDLPFIRVNKSGVESIFTICPVAGTDDAPQVMLHESQMVVRRPDGEVLTNGRPLLPGSRGLGLHPVGYATRLLDDATETGPLGPLAFLRAIRGSDFVCWTNQTVREADGGVTTIYVPRATSGRQLLSPGGFFQGLRGTGWTEKVNFLSLMLALFCGTASLPHILIRYYTVKDERSARKSTIVGIASIGVFYVLTLFMGLGAMASGALDPSDTNMSAPLLARSLSSWLFAVISAIAFTTVLGTVSGLILASSGAVTHDLWSACGGPPLGDRGQVRLAKLTAVAIGGLAIYLGIQFKALNVTYLVGWAFSIAASANLPALVMLLFWRGTTWQGIVAAALVGMLGSLGWILLSAESYTKVYGLPADRAWVPFSQPGIVMIPMGFVTLVLVSWLTRRK